MLWDGLAAREGRGPSPRAGCMAARPGPADREAGDGGVSVPPAFQVPAVLPQAGGLASNVQVAIAQGGQLCPRTLSHEDVSFLCYKGPGQSKALSYSHPYSSCPAPSCQCQAMAPMQSAIPGREGLQNQGCSESWDRHCYSL